MRAALFLIGIVITVLGWLFDRATQFKWLLKLIATDYVMGMAVLDALASNEKITVLAKHRGVTVLLERWPRLSDKDRVERLGRSVAFMQFGSVIGNDIELIAWDEKQSEVGKRWSDSGARKMLTDERDKRLFWIGAVVFYVGLVITLSTGLLEFFGK